MLAWAYIAAYIINAPSLQLFPRLMLLFWEEDVKEQFCLDCINQVVSREEKRRESEEGREKMEYFKLLNQFSCHLPCLDVKLCCEEAGSHY